MYVYMLCMGGFGDCLCYWVGFLSSFFRSFYTLSAIVLYIYMYFMYIHVCTSNIHVLPCRNAFCGQVQCKRDGTFQSTGGIAVSYRLNSGVLCRYAIIAYQKVNRLYVGKAPTHPLTLTYRMAQNKPFTYMYSTSFFVPTKTLKVVLPCFAFFSISWSDIRIYTHTYA